MKIGIVGSGPTGAAAAAAALARGHRVEIIDFGNTAPADSLARAARLRQAIETGRPASKSDLAALRTNAHFEFRSLLGLLPFAPLKPASAPKSIMGSNFVFDGVDDELPTQGASPPRSLAKGGLSNVWGTACYKLRDSDYATWPIAKADLEPHYASAAKFLGLSSQSRACAGRYPPARGKRRAADDIAWNIGSPVNALVSHWRKHDESLAKIGLRGGPSSLATLTPDAADPRHCRGCGLCLSGCPFDSMFETKTVIDDWRDNAAFKYRGGVMAESFQEEAGGVRLTMRRRDGGHGDVVFDRLILAANTLSSLRIASDSLGLPGIRAPLLDNDLFVVPMFAIFAAAQGWRSNFSLSEGILAMDGGIVSERPVHIQFYACNDYFLGAAGRLLPLAVRRSFLFRHLVIAFVYLDSAESRRGFAIPRPRHGRATMIEIEQHDRHGRAIAKRVLSYLRKHRKMTGLKPLNSMLKATPFGFSGHLAGTIPMCAPGASTVLRTDLNGLIDGTARVFVADASNFPSLPAQNPTYTAVANAIRIVSKF